MFSALPFATVQALADSNLGKEAAGEEARHLSDNNLPSFPVIQIDAWTLMCTSCLPACRVT